MAQSVRLQDAISEYVAFRKTDDVATRTVQSDEMFLRALLTETGNIFVKSINITHVQRLFAAKSESWGISTRNIAKVHLNGFFRYCRTRGWMSKDEDPVKPFKRRKAPPRHHLRIPATKFTELLDAAEHPRDRAFVALGLFLFLRPSESITLQVRDVDLDTGYIEVYVHKTKKRDRMPITAELDAELRRYLTWYTSVHGEPHPDWLLVPAKAGGNYLRDGQTGRFQTIEDATGEHIAPLRPSQRMRNPERIVQSVLESLGYPTEREGGHTLRRSGARAYFDQLCADGYSRALKRISAMLHHDSVATTEIYLGLDVDIEERDSDLRGKPMFPQLQAPNVVNLREASS